MRKGMHRVGAIKAVAASAGLSNVVVHAPPLPVQFGTYHSKAFMIEYEAGMRVVVHTANLIYVDCNNKTQGLWFQDFPRKVGSVHHSLTHRAKGRSEGDSQSAGGRCSGRMWRLAFLSCSMVSTMVAFLLTLLHAAEGSDLSSTLTKLHR